MGNELRHKLAVLSTSVGEMKKAPMWEKPQRGEQCLAQALDLLGALVERVNYLEKEHYG